MGKSASLVRRDGRKEVGRESQTERGERNAKTLKSITRLRPITHINPPPSR